MPGMAADFQDCATAYQPSVCSVLILFVCVYVCVPLLNIWKSLLPRIQGCLMEPKDKDLAGPREGTRPRL